MREDVGFKERKKVKIFGLIQNKNKKKRIITKSPKKTMKTKEGWA